MKRERLGVAESVNAIKDRKIDAFFWVGGLPTAAVTDLANTPGIKIKMIDHADAGAGDEQEVRQPVRRRTRSRKDIYQGMDADNKQATVMNILVAHEKHGRQDRLQHRQDDLRQAATTSSRCTRKRRTSSSRTRRRRPRRFPFHPGRDEVLRRKGRQGQLSGPRAPTSTLAGLFVSRRAMSEEIARLHRPAAEVSDEALAARRGVSSRRRRARPTSSPGWLAGFVRAGRGRDVGCSTCTPPTRSCRRRALRPVHVALRAVPVLPACSRSRGASAIA